MRKRDVLVLGTGPAATQVAMKCSEAGRSVGVVDPRPFGGTCALRGCNPKKVLARAAELHDWIERSKGSGLHAQGPEIEWRELMAFKRTFTDPVTPRNEKSLREAGIEQLHGAPRFVSPTRVAIGDEQFDCRNIVVATGAVPVELGIPGEELMRSSDDFLELEALPGRVLFVGGGYISFEFAHVAARAGARVTIVERGQQPLAPFDPELVDSLVERTGQLGIELRTGSEVRAIEKRPGGGFLVEVDSHGKTTSIETDLVVHGAGRVPNTDGLDLEAGGVSCNRQGIEVDEFLKSVSNPAVHAAGDVAGTGMPPLSPVATEEGRILAHNLIGDEPRKPDYGPVPTAVFTMPALAAVGLGEDEARKRGLRFTTHTGDRSDYNSMKKVGATHSRYKVLVEESTGRILGAHLLGPDAAETINLFALAIRGGLTARQVKSTLFAFPTFAHDVRTMV